MRIVRLQHLDCSANVRTRGLNNHENKTKTKTKSCSMNKKNNYWETVEREKRSFLSTLVGAG